MEKEPTRTVEPRVERIVKITHTRKHGTVRKYEYAVPRVESREVEIKICAIPAHVSISKERMAEADRLLRDELNAYQDRVVASLLGLGRIDNTTPVKKYPNGAVGYLAEVKS